ncbi:hypothetical protein ACL1G7_12045 [Corynebacterium striatum]|nr:hypothetical protein [Corynebacterium striatum]HCG2913693.1 hypothetical protein [Corynebacterium striatum]HCG2998499.1 hypothetical protein [Corynebacterium striatum]HCG3006462.1 hypothetical protein [Corynebacterium striatum]HCG3009063.1 hypothetical protein [Corynebacterium striatum]
MNLKSQCSAWWKLTGKIEKTLVFSDLVCALILIAIGIIQLDLFVGLFGINIIFLAYATVRADLYSTLWNGSARLIRLGMHVTEALDKCTSIKVKQSGRNYYIEDGEC